MKAVGDGFVEVAVPAPVPDSEWQREAWSWLQ